MPTILAYLPDHLFEAACAAIPTLVRVGSLIEARSLLRATHVDGFICDPALDASNDAGGLFWLAADFPKLRITLYTVLGQDIARTLTRLASAGISDVVLFGYEDSPERWREVVARSAVSGTVQQALRALEPVLARVEPPLRYVLQEAFVAPRKFRTVSRMATAAAMHRRGVYRKLNAAGVRAVGDWIGWARLVNAYALRGEANRSGEEIAELVGYRSSAALSAHARALAGYGLDDLHREVPLQALVEMMAGRLAAPADSPAATRAAQLEGRYRA